MPKKTLTLSEKLERTLAKHNKRQQDNMALFRAEQKRQGLKANQPISLMDMMKGKKNR